MKLEMDESSASTILFCVIAIVLCIGVLGGCRMTEETRRRAIAAGLEERVQPGSTAVTWVKPAPRP